MKALKLLTLLLGAFSLLVLQSCSKKVTSGTTTKTTPIKEIGIPLTNQVFTEYSVMVNDKEQINYAMSGTIQVKFQKKDMYRFINGDIDADIKFDNRSFFLRQGKTGIAVRSKPNQLDVWVDKSSPECKFIFVTDGYDGRYYLQTSFKKDKDGNSICVTRFMGVDVVVTESSRNVYLEVNITGDIQEKNTDEELSGVTVADLSNGGSGVTTLKQPQPDDSSPVIKNYPDTVKVTDKANTSVMLSFPKDKIKATTIQVLLPPKYPKAKNYTLIVSAMEAGQKKAVKTIPIDAINGPFTQNVNQLNPGTSYYFRLSVQNGKNETIAESDEVEEVTPIK